MSQATDPTRDFLRQLDDASQWVIVRNVPIFAAHTRKDAKGKEYRVGRSELEKTVQTYQRMEREYGVVPRITLGHIRLDPNAPETSQPKIVGYGRNLKLGTFGPGKKEALLADCYFRKADYPQVKQYPYRSAEYYPNSHEITGIALLVRDPQLDLGMVAYRRGDEPCFRYVMENAMDPTATPNASDLSPEETQLAEKLMRYMCSKMPGMAQMMAPAPVPAPAPAPAPALPSATNGGPPKPKEDDKPDLNAHSVDPVHYQRLQDEVRTLQQQYLRAECGRVVERLAEEGYQLDVKQETETLIPLTPEQRTARVGYIRQYYRQAPIARSFIDVPVFAGLGDGKDSLDEKTTERIFQYQRDHNCDWDTAEAAIRAKK